MQQSCFRLLLDIILSFISIQLALSLRSSSVQNYFSISLAALYNKVILSHTCHVLVGQA